MKYRLVLIALGMLGLAGCSDSKREGIDARFDIAAQLSTNSIHIGDEVHLRVTAEVPSSHHRIEWPDLGENTNLVIRSKDVEGETATYTLTSFIIGDHVLASSIVTCVATDGTHESKSLPFLALSVTSLLEGTNSTPRDIAPLVQWRSSRPWMLPAVLCAIALLALLAGILLRRKTPAAKPAIRVVPPHEIALGALKALLAKRYVEDKCIDPFYTELSNIVRAYIEGRFGLRAPEQTTEEFIRETTSSRLLHMDHQLLVGEFLTQCDLVKFAKHEPQTSDMIAAHAAAERLVYETKPQAGNPVSAP